MSKLTRLFIACVCVASASVTSAACESGSVHEQLTCLQREICPNPSSEAERIACYQMISTALSGKEVPAAAPASMQASPAKSTTTSIAKPITAIMNSDLPASVTADGPGTSESKDTDVGRESRFSLSKLFKKVDADDDPNWAKVVYVRAQLKGTELIVLDNGQVWVENQRNPFRQFRKRDRVRISESGQLTRKDGFTASVSRVICDPAKPLRGRCQSLGKYLN